MQPRLATDGLLTHAKLLVGWHIVNTGGIVKNMKVNLSKFGAGLFMLAVLFFGLKSCVITVWSAPTKAETYSVHGDDGRSFVMIFLPTNETIFLYSEERPRFIEASLTKMRGSYGTHFFGRLWSVPGQGSIGSIFSYRIYPENARPVVMESTVLKKFVRGSGKQALSSEGDRTHSVILFTDSAIRFQDMWLTKVPTNDKFVHDLLLQLKA